jgi:hypothetical protein
MGLSAKIYGDMTLIMTYKADTWLLLAWVGGRFLEMKKPELSITPANPDS